MPRILLHSYRQQSSALIRWNGPGRGTGATGRRRPSVHLIQPFTFIVQLGLLVIGHLHLFITQRTTATAGASAAGYAQMSPPPHGGQGCGCAPPPPQPRPVPTYQCRAV